MPKRFQIFFLFAAAHFLSYFYRTANAVIARDLSTDMQLDAATLGLMSSLFFLSFAAAQIPVGIGLDRYGPRWVPPLLMLAGAIGSWLFASAQSFAMLAAGRALIGFGTAGILMGALKAFSRWFPAEKYATISTLMVGVGSCGAIVASRPLAWLNESYGWRAVFWGSGVVLALVAVAILLWVRNMPPGESWPASSNPSNEGVRTIFTTLRFWRIAWLLFCMNGVLLAFVGLWGGPYLLDIYQLDKTLDKNFDQNTVSNTLFIISLGTTLGFAACGWLGDRFGIARVVTVGAIVLIICQVILALHPALGWVRVIGALFGFSAATSIAMLPQARQLFPNSLTGRAVSAANMFGFAGSFVMQWAMGMIINRFPADAAGHYPPQAYTTTLFATAACTVLALFFYLPMIRGK